MEAHPARGGSRKTTIIVLVAVLTPIALTISAGVGGIVSLVTPRHYRVYNVGTVSCVVRGSTALVEVGVVPIQDEGFEIEGAKEVGALNSHVSAYGRLPPGVGFARGEVTPTEKQLSATFAKDGYYPPLKVESQSPFLVRLRITGTKARVQAIGVTINAGEPLYYQELPLNLSIRNGSCLVR